MLKPRRNCGGPKSPETRPARLFRRACGGGEARAGAGKINLQPVPASAILVFPVPLLAFGHPFDRLRQALGAGLLAFRLDDPVDIIAPAARRKSKEGGAGGRVGIERGGEI